jgi:putative membrane protein
VSSRARRGVPATALARPAEPASPARRREPIVLLVLGTVALAVSGIGPYDRTTWWLEVAPIFLGVPVLAATYRRFPLTPLAYRLILVHALILMAGGHYTYARVPLGFWVRDLLGLARNHYDRLGHFAQGFVPAILVREVLLRRTPLRRGGWLFFLVTSVCLAVSACYEFVEWWSAVVGGTAADAFLGTQGDVWDTQWDMFIALLGAVAAQLALSRLHDRELAHLLPSSQAAGAPSVRRPFEKGAVDDRKNRDSA